MVNLKESIKTFKHKYLAQGIELTNRFNNLVGDSIISIHYTRNWIGEEPIVIENGKCHHVPYNGLNIGLRSGKRVVIFDSNCFSEYGGTFGIDIRELESDEIFENQIDQTKDSNWNRLIGEKIRSIKILWLDDDGWRSPKEINGNIVMVPDEKSQGIFPHGIEMIFENGETIYVLAVEPDEYIKTEKRYHYLRGGEEFVIVFNKEVARNQKLIIQGVDLMIE
jgi:hypothetical protein